ncbi:MAG TPA: hypothetical protein VM388_11980 [Acidimicrobiales bacterium]|nr:hypothetical protein [Acidimicrobiales bacterium]
MTRIAAGPVVLAVSAGLLLAPPAQAQTAGPATGTEAVPPSFTLRGPADVAPSGGRAACPGPEKPCQTAAHSGAGTARDELNSARKAYQSPAYTGKVKAKRRGAGEVLTVTELQSCYGYLSPDVAAQADSRDPLVKMTTDRFVGPVPPVGDGNVSDVITRHYDAKGNLVYRERSSSGSEANVVTCGYDGRGNLISRTDNAWTLETFTAVIGKTGLVDVEAFSYDGDQDGVADDRRTVSYVYDDKGRRLSRTDVLDLGIDGVADYVGRESVTYDSTGLRSLVLLELDYDADGALDLRETSFAVRNGQGRLERSGREWDYDVDGVADQRLETNRMYDSQGVLTREVYESDYQADGVPEFRMETDFTYDSRGQVVRDESALYWELPFDAPDETEVMLWHYNAKAQLVRQVWTSDLYADGVADLTMTVDFVHDHQGNVVDYLSTLGGPDFGPSYRHETTKLDARGNILEVVLTTWVEGAQATAQGERLRFQYELPGK